MRLKKHFVRLEFKDNREAQAFFDSVSNLKQKLLTHFNEQLTPEACLSNLVYGAQDNLMNMQVEASKEHKTRLILPN